MRRNRCREFVMIKANRRRGTKGGIIIPKDKFKEFVEFQRRGVEEKSRR